MNQSSSQFDLARIIFSILFISLLIITCFWIVQPFILGFSWASMVVIATWPLLKKLQKLLWGKRVPAVLIMTLLLMLLFVIPVGFVVNSIVDNNETIVGWVSDPNNLQIPQFDWLKDIPLIGATLDHTWHSLIADGGKSLLAKVQPYAGKSTAWFIAQIANIGRFMLHGTLMILFSALLYYKGEAVGASIRQFALRLAPIRGDSVVTLGGQAIRAVALGIVVTALLQSILGGTGIALAGVNYAVLLTVLMFVSCLIQLGPLPVLVPVVIWLYWTGDNTWGTVLLVWSGLVATLDSVLRPILIRMGADLPFWLILSGVIGGLLSFGMIGLFIGPVVLAVAYRLTSAWVDESKEQIMDAQSEESEQQALLQESLMANNKTEDGLEDMFN